MFATHHLMYNVQTHVIFDKLIIPAILLYTYQVVRLKCWGQTNNHLDVLGGYSKVYIFRLPLFTVLLPSLVITVLLLHLPSPHTWLNRKAIPVHDTQHLLADILGSLQGTNLHKVLVTPWVGELVVSPWVVDSQQCEMVTLSLVELCFLLVCYLLLVLQTNHITCEIHRQQSKHRKTIKTWWASFLFICPLCSR